MLYYAWFVFLMMLSIILASIGSSSRFHDVELFVASVFSALAAVIVSWNGVAGVFLAILRGFLPQQGTGIAEFTAWSIVVAVSLFLVIAVPTASYYGSEALRGWCKRIGKKEFASE